MTVEFSYCTRCGSAVPPYPYGSESLGGWIASGIDPPAFEDSTTYFCASCDRSHVAISRLNDTHVACPHCQEYMPTIARFCGLCGGELSR